MNKKVKNSKNKKMVATGWKQASSWQYQLYFILLVDCDYVMGGVILYHERKNATPFEAFKFPSGIPNPQVAMDEYTIARR